MGVRQTFGRAVRCTVSDWGLRTSGERMTELKARYIIRGVEPLLLLT